jgi:hypothetical protein
MGRDDEGNVIAASRSQASGPPRSIAIRWLAGGSLPYRATV